MENDHNISNDQAQMKKKKTLGKRKISIKKIENSSHLQVTFSKRRVGLFKKAACLSVLCGVDLAILVSSPAKLKVFAFGSPSPDAVIDRFLAEQVVSTGCENPAVERSGEGELELEDWWWITRPVESMGIEELKEYIDALEKLKSNVDNRVSDLATGDLAAEFCGAPAVVKVENDGMMARGFGDFIGEAPVDNDFVTANQRNFQANISGSSERVKVENVVPTASVFWGQEPLDNDIDMASRCYFPTKTWSSPEGVAVGNAEAMDIGTGDFWVQEPVENDVATVNGFPADYVDLSTTDAYSFSNEGGGFDFYY